MAELHVSNRMALKDVANPFDDRNNYQKVMRYGDTALTNEIQGALDYIFERNENERLETIYCEATEEMTRGHTHVEYEQAAKKFQSISHYKDSAVLAAECLERADVSRKDGKVLAAEGTMSGGQYGDYLLALSILGDLSGWKNADELRGYALKKVAEIGYKYVQVSGTCDFEPAYPSAFRSWRTPQQPGSSVPHPGVLPRRPQPAYRRSTSGSWLRYGKPGCPGCWQDRC